MVKLLCLLAWVAFHYDQVHSGNCSISSANIHYYHGSPEGTPIIQLGWSRDNPAQCEVTLEEEVLGKDNNQMQFNKSDTQTCKSGKYCYFKASRISCVDDEPQIPTMKFSTNCKDCNIASFTFTIGGSTNDKNITTSCSKIIYPGSSSPRDVDNFKFSECGQNRTCTKVGNNVGPGCYCEDGYVLNATTGLCVDQSVCPVEKYTNIALNLKTPGCVKLGHSVEVVWVVEAWRNYIYTIKSSGDVVRTETLSGQTDLSKGFTVVGKLGTLTIPSNGLGPGQYSFEVEDIFSDKKNVETGNFSIKVGKCHLQPYTGSESTLTISVRKNGGTADQVAIRYRG